MIKQILLFVLVSTLFGWNVSSIQAQQCSSGGGGCPGGSACTGIDSLTGYGSCTQQGCFENVCTSPDVCSGDVCMPAGGGGSCPCGEKADGSCKPCGGDAASCYGTINCAANAIDPNSYNTIYIGETRYSNSCPPLGNAQSLAWTCADDVCAWRMTIHACCASGSEVACHEETGGTVTLLRDNTNYWVCGEERDIYVSTNTNTGIVRFGPYRDCNEDGCYWNTEYWWQTTCIDVYDSCACASVCHSTAPSSLAVVQGASATTANVSWSVGTGGSSQRIYVDQSQTEVNNGCTTAGACEVSATLASGSNSYIVTGLLPNTTYYFRVATYENATCTLSQTQSYTTPDVTLSGRVYLDENNNCSTANPWSLGGLTVTARGSGYSGSVGSDGRFGFFAGGDPLFSYLDLTGYSSSYVPSTAAGCSHGSTLTSVSNPSTTNYFYLTPLREAWWQAVGGSVYANGSIRSELPSANEMIIAPDLSGEYGALMHATGTVDSGAGAVSDAGYTAITRYGGKTMNYDYFAAQMGVTPNTQNYWGTNTITKPTTLRDFYYLAPTGGNPAMISGLSVAVGESYVIFVNGDARIAADVVVAEGGFLAVIVNGSLTISPAVSAIEGLYVIDGTLVTESNQVGDVSANFGGSVVSWGGVNLGRDLVANNVVQPGEKFEYRPDLLVNMPENMKVFALRWVEVVPGTIGN